MILLTTNVTQTTVTETEQWLPGAVDRGHTNSKGYQESSGGDGFKGTYTAKLH